MANNAEEPTVSADSIFHDGIPVQDHIHDRLEFYFNSLSLPWTAPMEFPMHVGLYCSHDETETTIVDICAFVAGNAPESALSKFAYFDRSLFPHVDHPRISDVLHRALVESAAKAGFQIARNGRSYTHASLSG